MPELITSKYMEFNSLGNVGNNVQERLPNIKGHLGYLISTLDTDVSMQFDGALTWGGYNDNAGVITKKSGHGNFDIIFDASQFDPTYKDYDSSIVGTVKPRAISMCACIKY